MNPLIQLQQQGQSVWLDFITRRFIAEGKLSELIQKDGLRGVTSNPTIFQKAITGSADYDQSIRTLIEKGESAAAIFDAVAVEDIQKACDAFKDVYASTQGLDGYVSLEVSPMLSRDTQGTLDAARRLNKAVNRPNVMIKIPATVEGLPAIQQALAEGININITLIFSLDRYEKVIEAWLSGLEKRAAAGQPVKNVASVASFFVSRVDAAIDKQLDEKKPAGYESLKGKAAIANAQEAYALFEKMLSGPRFKALEAKGAHVQRPLWASTSSKNPAYRDVIYVEELIGAHTVNTLPQPTIDAFRDHGVVKRALPASGNEWLVKLSQAGIDMKAVTDKLEVDGLRLFEESYTDLLKSIDQKKAALV